ncbi:calcium:proton antiporter [Sphingomonas adhaesiva]|uniref:calcium:proton antiporter n=1 Tax=Sphingomonas adhaesiva TaxID=28212 RepID=UPI002FF58906
MTTSEETLPPPATRRALLHRLSLPLWTLLLPVLGVLAVLTSIYAIGSLGTILASAILIGCVLAAVHHAEVVAHRVGEPFGTLVLAIAVTVIEVSLIVSLMLSDAGDASALARDTVFAAIMIILNGIIGICLMAGGLRHREQRFSLRGVSAALCTLAALAVLTLVLPNYTSTTPGPYYATSQLVLVAVVSLFLYGVFVTVQTVRHREYFLPEHDSDDDHAPVPSNRTAWIAFGILLVALVAVVLLAKALSVTVERAVLDAGLPLAVVGVVIAALVLAPESLAAYRAARRNRIQTSLNLALGSALATIGLTIPAVAIVSLMLDLPLALGLGVMKTVLLALSLFVATISLGTGRTTVMQGAVHLVIFAVYLFTTVVP